MMSEVTQEKSNIALSHSIDSRHITCKDITHYVLGGVAYLTDDLSIILHVLSKPVKRKINLQSNLQA